MDDRGSKREDRVSEIEVRRRYRKREREVKEGLCVR